MSPPTVSVLMPAYNARRYVARAVESILAQTFDDFELLIIDDGSTDDTRQILERLAARDARVRVVSRPNTGYVVALNELIGMARGELLARMDADDVALPERFARQVAYLRDHPEVVCLGGGTQTIDGAGRVVGLDEGRGLDHEEALAVALSGSSPMVHPTIMVRRSAMEAVGGYQVRHWPAEDLDLYLRLAEVGRLARLPEAVLQYRYHPGSVSEKHQQAQLERFREITAEAAARLGRPHEFVERPPWRPVDRAGRQRFALWFGWSGFNAGRRAMALEYAAKAIALGPLRREPWVLMACALIKPMRRPEPVVDGPEAGRPAAAAAGEDGARR